MNKIVNGVANDYEFPDLDWVHHDSKTFDEEKFMEEVERRYIERHTTHIKGYTEEYVKILLTKIDQLTNNWNELRQHIKEYLEEWEDSDDEWIKGKCDMARDILYDMEEIKDGNNVSDRD